MFIIKDKTNMFESFKEKLYHGSAYLIEKLDWKKFPYGIFWTTNDKKIALDYANDAYYVKSEFNYIYEIDYAQVKIADLTNINDKYLKYLKDWYEPIYKYKSFRNEELTLENFLKNYCDFSLLEMNPQMIKGLKYKKIDVIKIKDNTSKKNHISYGFINKNKVLNLNLVEKIKR